MNANLQYRIVAFVQRKIICIYFKITTFLIENIHDLIGFIIDYIKNRLK